MSTKKYKPPEPIPLKARLEEGGRTQVWFRDHLSVNLNRNISEDYLSRVLNGRRPVPSNWVLPLAEILGINVDEARELLGFVHAEV